MVMTKNQPTVVQYMLICIYVFKTKEVVVLYVSLAVKNIMLRDTIYSWDIGAKTILVMGYLTELII